MPVIGRKRLKSLSVTDVRKLMQSLHDKGLSVSMVQSVHAVLRNALENAMRDELVMRNVAKMVKVKTPTYDIGRGLTVDQARTLLGCRSARFHAAYVLAVYLGLRRAEVLGLRWKDIDLDWEGDGRTRAWCSRVPAASRWSPKPPPQLVRPARGGG